MIKGSFAEASPFLRILLAGIILLVFMIVFSILGIILASLIYDKSLVQLAAGIQDYSDPQNIRIVKLLQVVQSIGLFLLPPFIIGWFLHTSALGFLSLKNRPSFARIILSSVVMFSVLPLVNFLGSLNERMSLPDFLGGVERWMQRLEEQGDNLLQVFLQFNHRGDFWINLFVIAVLPGIGEELLFRGVIQRLFIDWTRNRHAGILVTAALFSIFHMQFYGFVPRMLMGVMFGYMLVWSGSLWYPILAHFINNGMAVFYYYFAGAEKVPKDLENIGSGPGSFYLVLLSVAVTGVILWMFYRMEGRKEKRMIRDGG
jgi:membrane protease YdiL (CAAX protease family)